MRAVVGPVHRDSLRMALTLRALSLSTCLWPWCWDQTECYRWGHSQWLKAGHSSFLKTGNQTKWRPDSSSFPLKRLRGYRVFAVKNFKWPRAFEGECRTNKTQDYLCRRNTPAFHTLSVLLPNHQLRASRDENGSCPGEIQPNKLCFRIFFICFYLSIKCPLFGWADTLLYCLKNSILVFILCYLKHQEPKYIPEWTKHDQSLKPSITSSLPNQSNSLT